MSTEERVELLQGTLDLLILRYFQVAHIPPAVGRYFTQADVATDERLIDPLVALKGD